RRFPLIATTIVVLVLVSYIRGDTHNVEPEKFANDSQPAQIGIADAVEHWKIANGCAKSPEKCPSPIIVASAGGASRAAFMTRPTLGLLLDATCLDNEHQQLAKSKVESNMALPTSCAEAPAFGERLFAVSSVSGGSLGAVVYARGYRDGNNGKAYA